ncbi:hypothetical protein [Microbacterium telephonicum]|uniref:Uncharacterized protein n=1 Tax=Microbacterium telephonicum TaxID=1714841 RepID=A0A498BXG2_9MICO|nr:hypothetical protein [Microbacterium telephonicum]RLK47607.1 hypothetical protein C7474_2199 [Microbacterium telephonicum]
MNDKLIPADAQLAAKRGFIRTTAQAYGTSLAGGITSTAVLAVVTGEVPLVATAVTWGVALVSPLIAGAASYFSILARGIPGDYAPEA